MLQVSLTVYVLTSGRHIEEPFPIPIYSLVDFLNFLFRVVCTCFNCLTPTQRAVLLFFGSPYFRASPLVGFTVGLEYNPCDK